MMSLRIPVLAVAAIGFLACDGEPDAAGVDTPAAQTSPLDVGGSLVDYGGMCTNDRFSPTTCTVRASSENGGTNLTAMHCCPPSYGMQGYYAASDSLYCRYVSYPQGVGGGTDTHGVDRSNCVWRQQTRTVDGKQMNGCNTGEYMIGFHKGYNRIACCPTNQSVTERVDGDNPGFEPHTTDRQYPVNQNNFRPCTGQAFIHVCTDFIGAESELMVGIDLSHNYFICAL